MARRPVLADTPAAARRPVPETVPDRRRWSFSFRYWQQPPDFGLGDQQGRWFVSLFNRLGEMSRSRVADVMGDPAVMDTLRIHDIDWAAKNIPIERGDIDWVDPVYWGNPDEFPLIQFHISRALGRVAGFIDENGVFNVVLLDPMHNLQPSAFNGHRIRATTFGTCALTSLTASVEQVVLTHDELSADGRKRILDVVRAEMSVDGRLLLILPADEGTIDAVDTLISLGTHTGRGEYLMSVIEDAFERLRTAGA